MEDLPEDLELLVISSRKHLRFNPGLTGFDPVNLTIVNIKLAPPGKYKRYISIKNSCSKPQQTPQRKMALY